MSEPAASGPTVSGPANEPGTPSCRSCRAPLDAPFLDLGRQPLSNAYVSAADVAEGRDHAYPLRIRFCRSCTLVQADDAVAPDAIFNADYAYYSSFSTTWLEHARRFAAAAIPRFGLNAASRVLEVGSNDGYLLQYFVQAGIPVLGIEPSDGAAAAARARGIPTETAFFGVRTGRHLRERGITADLVFGANVLAHVPDLDDFLGGLRPVLRPGGTVCFEFPHLLQLMAQTQFDTIYHEHYSYLSLAAVERALARNGLAVHDLDVLPTHGGSLRLYCAEAPAPHPAPDTAPRQASPAVQRVRDAEREAGLGEAAAYTRFAAQVDAVRAGFLGFLATARREGRSIAAYGAAAKGNTFLNTCGVTAADVLCVFDRNPHKQGRLLPQSHIPILPPEEIEALRPDYVLILPWNLRDEISRQLAPIARWGGRFVTAIPDIQVFDPPQIPNPSPISDTPQVPGP